MPRLHSTISRFCAVPLVSLMATSPGVAAKKTVEVHNLSGQSTVVGIGQVSGNDVRWGRGPS